MKSTPLRATVKELKEAGISFKVTRAKNHHKVWFTVNNLACMVVCSHTQSDHRALLNARLEVKRKIRRAMGTI